MQKKEEGLHLCPSCIVGAGFSELGLSEIGENYTKLTPCDSCRSPIETCLSKGEMHSKHGAICDICKMESEDIDRELLGEWEMRNNRLRNIKEKENMGTFNDEIGNINTEYHIVKIFIKINRTLDYYIHIYDPSTYYNEERRRIEPLLSYDIVVMEHGLDSSKLDAEIADDIESHIINKMWRYGEDHNEKFENTPEGAALCTESAFKQWRKLKNNNQKQKELFNNIYKDGI